MVGAASGESTGPAGTLAGALPAPTSTFFGRDEELAGIVDALARPRVRLLTLVGPAGTGKTRLALEAGWRLRDVFPGGVRFAPLAPLRDAALVLGTAARALGLRADTGRPILEQLTAQLGARPVLLVLDNVEHVLAAAEDVGQLLASCAGLRILATGRAPLHVYGERELPVRPLPVPDPQRLPAPAELARVPSVALFVERARAVQPDFGLGPDSARQVAEICARLDGLPLALELAAARTKLFSAQALLARLQGAYGQTPLRLLGGAAAGLPERHQTLRGAIAWSYALLPPQGQRLLRHLGVFAGGCTEEAARAVCGGPERVAPRVPHVPAALDGLEALVDQSLVVQTPQPDGEPRFSLLETVREYALEQLDAAGEGAAARAAHAGFYVQLAEAAAPHLRAADQDVWLEALGREHDNCRQALAWLRAHGHDPTRVAEGLRLATALRRFWELRGHAAEGRTWLERLLALPAAAPEVRARALAAAGALAYEHDAYAEAEAAYAESLRLSRSLGDAPGEATALAGLGDARRFGPEREAGLRLYGDALAIWRALGDREQVAQVLYAMGTHASADGDHRRAREWLDESLALRRALGDPQGVAWSLHILAVSALRLGDLDAAQRTFEEGLAARRAAGDELGAAYSLARIGQTAILRGRHAAAIAPLLEGIAIGRRFGDRWYLMLAADHLAHVLIGLGQHALGLRAAGAAERAREELGVVLPPSDRELHEPPIAGARRALGAAADEEWQAGRRLDLAQALDAAVGAASAAAWTAADPVVAAADPDAPQGPAAATQPDPLTRREREVAALVAQGLTNKQIAARLAISERTADTHVQNILGKLGFAGRAQVAAWAVTHGAGLAPSDGGSPRNT